MLSRKGFTLLELMLALALFASGTVAIMELLRQAEASRTDGENILIATHLAQRRLEELRQTAYGSIDDESKASVSSPSGFDHFSREVEVTTPYTDLKQIVVKVYWAVPGEDEETDVSLQTYRANL